ncbi:transglutaminase-like cysteine peptidase [Iodobacter sp. CM08]|uniref:transglutaminase-like cysteine peptidase n=1 Tax=Iodobacter sp. CM08 TaxID=3085902 RepID=UPI002982717C|nr:transglutaminase-like cysteine peptidase [Iodobacter sp. CM08]MDW5415385.1 transglutaminase-like cysteine peptidase [Iodobacter sp. CM08]
MLQRPLSYLQKITIWLLIATSLALHAAAGLDFDRLQKSLVQRWGQTPVRLFSDWQTLINEARNVTETDKLKRINDFFNRRIQFGDDQTIWNAPDYWATPLETIGKGAGDCEDFAIIKYFSLKELGVAKEKLRLTYVKAKIGGASSNISQAHMVLTYYSSADAEPLVLDNLLNDIRPASRRPDLTPVFSFNSDGIFTGASAQPSGPVDKLSRWKDLISKMKAEGYEAD